LIQTRSHVRNAIASRERQVVMRKVKSTIDILKNVLSRGTPGYCKWHPKVPQHPGWEPLC